MEEKTARDCLRAFKQAKEDEEIISYSRDKKIKITRVKKK